MKKIISILRYLFLRVSVVITVATVVAFLASLYFYSEHERVSAEKTKNFQVYQDQQLVKKAATRLSLKQKKKPLKEIVLLLHSFSTSPEDYSKIFQLLDKKNISYYAPVILGFGLTDTDILEKIEAEDWIRDAISHYNICSELAEEVHVIGQSLGGLLAMAIALQGKVNKLVILSPTLYFKGKALEVQKELEDYVWKRLFFEYIKKYITLHPEVRSIFRYESLPFRSLMALVKLQSMIRQNPKDIRANSIDILYGKQDKLSDIKKALEYLDNKKISYKKHSYNAPHSLFIDFDYEQDKIIKDLGEIFEN